SLVRVYRAPNSRDQRGYRNYDCLRSRGVPDELDGDGFWAFPPPAMALNGPVLGLAHNDCTFVPDQDQGPFPCLTRVLVLDYATGQDVRYQPAGPLTRKGGLMVKVGSLRVSRDGAVAWITCPEHDEDGSLGQRSPNCVRPGDRDSVWTLNKHAHHPKL